MIWRRIDFDSYHVLGLVMTKECYTLKWYTK